MPCTLAQLQNQTVYAGANCTAVLPDFRSKATVIGGCTGFTLSQIPAPGATIKANTSVILRATGTNGKSSQISFMALFVDTITPKIIFPLAQVDSLLKKSNQLYDIADRMVGQIDSVFTSGILVIASWDSSGVRQRFISYTDTFSLDILK